MAARSSHTKSFVVAAFLVLGLLLAVPAQAADVLWVIDDKVGIGTSAPVSTLEVSGAGNAKVTVTDTSAASAFRSLFELSNLGRTSFTIQNRSVVAQNSLWYFLVSNAGRFAIGRAGSGVDELQVTPAGDLIITGQLTTAGGNYPDYVFEPGYPLMPLPELDAYIQANGHLPGIPAAEETADGARVNMSELQLRLLEKVEELTLYTIEQEKRLAMQTEQLRRLEERIAATSAPALAAADPSPVGTTAISEAVANEPASRAR